MKDSTFIILLAVAIVVAGVLVYMARKKKSESSANKKEPIIKSMETLQKLKDEASKQQLAAQAVERDAEIAERIEKQFLERFHGNLRPSQRALMEHVIAEEQEKARQQAALTGADGKLRTLK